MRGFEENVEMRAQLRQSFDPAQIGKLPATQKRPELDFVGHAAVTDRLNLVAPGWTYVVDELFSVESTVWIRGTMIVGGVSRVEYGDGDDPKEALGNFIRRAAMRFGVAIDLWSRQELTTSAPVGGSGRSPSPGAEHSSSARATGVIPPEEQAGESSEAPLSSSDPAAAGTPPKDSAPSPGRRLLAFKDCPHTEFGPDDRCLGCNAPASRIERVTT